MIDIDVLRKRVMDTVTYTKVRSPLGVISEEEVMGMAAKEMDYTIKMKITPKAQWINPDDRLPEEGVWILFALCGTVYSGRYSTHRPFPRDVTAWMPWPVAPKSRDEI